MFTFFLTTPNNDVAEFLVKFFYPHARRKHKNKRRIVCKIYHKDTGQLVCEGYSMVNRDAGDHYIKAEGRKYALTHAIDGFVDVERAVIWGYFFEAFPLKD